MGFEDTLFIRFLIRDEPMAGTKQKQIAGAGLATLVLAMFGTCLAEEEYHAERYRVIVDRSPFGADPLLAIAEQEKSAKEAAAAMAASKELRLCFLLESETGEIRAGFQNKKPGPGDPKSVILMVGESYMGMKLLEIDLAESKATLQRNGVPVIFELTKPTVAAKAPSKKMPPPRKFGGGFRRPAPKKVVKAPEPKLSPAEQRRRREEIRANLQNYQMEVIRSGMPPLPIPLTQEMDDQLVAEGVLPPEE
jgi:hypothetical protein